MEISKDEAIVIDPIRELNAWAIAEKTAASNSSAQNDQLSYRYLILLESGTRVTLASSVMADNELAKSAKMSSTSG